MNLFKSLKNRKGMSGAVKASIIFLALAFVIASVSYIIPAFADTHVSKITVTPSIVPGGAIGQNFIAHVECVSGPDKIHEVRIYEHFDFSNITCYPVAGWYGPFPGQNQYGKFCLWTAMVGNELCQVPGDSKDLPFSANTPATECCREWLMETRDLNNYWIFNYPKICIDTTPPLTTKSFIGPYKIDENDVEWIDGVTKVILNATDNFPQKHDAGIYNISWRNTIVDDAACWSISACGKAIGNGDWSEVKGNSTVIEKDLESCHLLEFYAVDNVGNVEQIKKNCFFVDKTPPKMIKTIGDPKYGDCPREQEDCTGWDCLGQGTKDFFATGRHDPTNWDLAIKTPPEVVQDSDEYSWINGGNPIPFKVTYDSSTGKVTYNVDGKILEYTYSSGKAFDYLVVMAKGASGGCDMSLTDVKVNGKDIGDVISSANYKGKVVYLTDTEQINGFVVEGYASMVWQSVCKKQEIPAFHVFAMNTHNLDPQDCWVRDHVTPITLDCKDPQPHPSGDEEVCYKVSLDSSDVTDQYCLPEDLEFIEQEGYEGTWCCVPSPEQIIFEEDSLHDLEYFCRDAVDKKSPIDKEWLRVDSQPPIITKTMLGEEGKDYLGNCPPKSESDKCYVANNGKGGIQIVAKDDDRYPICHVDNLDCLAEFWWETSQEECFGHGYKVYENGWCKVYAVFFNELDIVKYYFQEDSKHKVVVNCKDALGNKKEDIEYFLVDSTPPVTTKTYGDPHYPPGINEGASYPHWITSDTPITLKATDNKVSVDKIYWRDIVVEDRYCNSEFSGCQNYKVPPETPWENQAGDQVVIKKNKESCHLLEFYATDKLGNKETTHRQCVFADITPPKTEKTFDGLVIEKEGYKYINQNTGIVLTCNDQEPHPVDHSSIKYRYRVAEKCEDLEKATWTDWQDPDSFDPVVKTIHFTEDSCHELEYYCVDVLGNKEDIKSEIDIVDTKPPVITKEIVGPQFYNETEKRLYIDGKTEIHVNAKDPEPHPVDEVKCKWWYFVDSNGPYYVDSEGKKQEGKSGDIVPPFVITFPEETKHNLHVKCWDALNNEVAIEELYYVDKTPPVTTKTYGKPYFENSTGEWITSDTPITLTVEDAGTHKSGIKETKYRYEKIGDIYCNKLLDTYCAKEITADWQTYKGEPFKIDEQSCHKIEYFSVDNVGKVEKIKSQCVYVDNTPPSPIKTVGKPRTEWDGEDANFYDIKDLCWSLPPEQCKDPEVCLQCWKVTLFTPITLDCVDPMPHPVDHEETCFKVGVDGDDETVKYCGLVQGQMEGEWCCGMNAPFEFRFNEETEHELEYYCVDALGNRGDKIDIEKFKVEGTAFEIQLNKKWNLISVPFVMLSDSIDEVFKDVADDVESVWTYDAEIGEWYIYTPNDGPDTLHEMIPGWGYWVLANDDTILVIGGSLFSPATTPPSKKVVHGWNLIGYYGTEGETGYYNPVGSGRSAYCALYSLVDTTIGHPKWSSLVSYWEPYNGIPPTYQWIYLDTFNNMDPGAGYWLEIDVTDTYTFASACGYGY